MKTKKRPYLKLRDNHLKIVKEFEGKMIGLAVLGVVIDKIRQYLETLCWKVT